MKTTAINAYLIYYCSIKELFRKKFVLFAILSLSLFMTFAQTFSGNSGPIDDNSCPATNDFATTAAVSGVGILGSTNYFNQVEINITHTYVEDLVIALSAPNGTTVLLSSGNGGNGTDYINTVFRDDAPTYIVSGLAPFIGGFIPEGFFCVFDGINADGIWTLKICDGADVDDETLDSWGITFDDAEILSDCATNPINPAPLCNAFKLIVVLDESGSIDDGPNGATNELAVEEATLSLVEVLIGTGAQVSLIEFGPT